MELVKYHKMRTAVQGNASPGRPDELRTIAAQLQRSLMESGLFAEVEVDATDNVDNLVIAMCTFPPEASHAQVAARLERLWEDRLRYQFWEAHSMIVHDDQVELQGATRTSTEGYYVTMHVVAQKAPIPAQRTGSRSW